MSFCCCLVGSGVVWHSKFFSRSFRLSRVSSEIWLCWFNVQTRPDVKGCELFWSSSKFQRNARFPSREQREQAAGSQYFRPEISVPPTRCSSNEIVSVGGAPPTWINLPCVNFICLVILSHEENILADFYMCYKHTLWAKDNFHPHQIIATEMSFH